MNIHSNNNQNANAQPLIGSSTEIIRPASRRLFLKGSAALTLAGASSAILAGSSRAHAAPPTAAEKEELKEVTNKGAQKGMFVSIRQHENDHVAFLVNALGSSARPKPTFTGLQQTKFAQFVILAQTFENTGVAAYLGAAPSINSMQYLAAAGSIMTVEARHSGYINSYLKDPITGNSTDDDANPSFDAPLTAQEVATAVTPFISSLNGGPAVDYSTTPSDANDIAILNFALALEYLEAEFYNLNVPTFYKHT